MKEEREALDRLLAENDFLRELAEADMRESMERWRRQQVQPVNYLPDQSRIPDEHSEMGLATCFARLRKNAVQFVPAWGWMVWDGKLWRPNDTAAARRQCISYLDEMLSEAFSRAALNPDDPAAVATLKWARGCRSARAFRAVFELAQPQLTTDGEHFDADPWLLNTQGGIVDLKTGQARPHDFKAYCTMICNADPANAWEGTRWAQFLKDVTCNDAELESYLQMFFGMAAVGKVYQEGVAIFYGGGANGKSTLCNPIREALGGYAGTIAPEILMASRERGEVRGLAGLCGKRFVLASETEEGQRLSPSVIKRMASTDAVSARKLYREAFDFVPSHTLVLFTNFLPRIGGTDNGIWRRIYAVPFNARFDLDSKATVPNYGDVLLKEERGAILRWIIDGARLFHKNGRQLPPAPKCVRDATSAYRSGEDWIGNFISERCEVGDTFTAQGGQLYAAYKVWAEGNGDYVRRNRDFAAALRALGYWDTHAKTGARWYGLKLLPASDGVFSQYL